MAELKLRSDIHWARKLWHMIGVSIIAICYAVFPEYLSLILLTALASVSIFIDLIRLKNPNINSLVMATMGPIMRKSEVAKFAGTSYLLSGVTLIAFIFPKQIVLLSLLFLAFADPLASYFGIRFGKDKIFGEKSLQGTLAAFVVCSLITYLFLNTHWLFLDRKIIISLIAGIVGALAELLPLGKLDDNFTLPVLSAPTLWILFSMFGAFAAN